MFCKKCGKEIKEGEKFCPNCGEPINHGNNNQNGNADYVYSNTSFQGTQTAFARKRKFPTKLFALGIGVIAVVIVIGLFLKSADEQETAVQGGVVQSPENEIMQFNLNVVNNTGIDIYRLYASEVDVDNWEEDVLGDQILYAGESIVIEFTITEEDMDWDFAMEDIDGNMIEFYDLSFEGCNPENATLVLEMDGFNGIATLY